MFSTSINTRLRQALTAGVYPASITIFFLFFIVFWRFASLPTPEELTQIVENLFRSHGWWIVGIAAFLEGVAVINLYFPGSLVIVLGVTSSLGNPTLAIIMVGITILGFLASSLVNYAIGYYGFHHILLRIGGKDWFNQVQTWHHKYGARSLLLAYFHPNVGGLMVMACGNAHYSFSKMIQPTFVAILVWNTFWGALAYWLAPTLRTAAASIWPIFFVLLIWTLVTVCRAFFRTTPSTKH